MIRIIEFISIIYKDNIYEHSIKKQEINRKEIRLYNMKKRRRQRQISKMYSHFHRR